MNAEIPSDWAPFVQRMVAERRFRTEGDVLAEGLRLLQAREIVRRAVRLGFEQLDAGSGVDAAEAYERAERRVDKIEKEGNAAR
jgi:Arc/MetJ-type ribon-helix-helix transcriptional regulator